MPLDVPIPRLDLVAVDLETTGTAPTWDAILEIGAARFTLDREGRVTPGPTLSLLVSPGRTIPGPTQRLTGIAPEMVAGAPPLEVAWEALARFLAASDDRPTLALAHRAVSDLGFLVTAAERLGRPLELPPFACTLEVSRAVLTDAPTHQLGGLVTWLGCAAGAPPVFHRALPDALHTRNLLARCVALRGARTLRELGLKAPVAVPRVSDLEVVVPTRLAGLTRAVEDQRDVWIAYAAGSRGREPRRVTPLGFYRSGDQSYLRAHCHLDLQNKSFRLDRIRRVSDATE